MVEIEILKKARELISKEENWCQDWFAKLKNGQMCSDSSESAVQWCSIGALFKVGLKKPGQAIRDDETYIALNKLAIQAGAGSLSDFNDTRTHQEVLALFDKAIYENSL